MPPQGKIHIMVDWDKTLARPQKANFDSIKWAIVRAAQAFGAPVDNELDLDEILHQTAGTTEWSMAKQVAKDLVLKQQNMTILQVC